MILVTEGSQCGPDASRCEHSAGYKSDPGKNLKPFFVEALPTYENKFLSAPHKLSFKAEESHSGRVHHLGKMAY